MSIFHPPISSSGCPVVELLADAHTEVSVGGNKTDSEIGDSSIEIYRRTERLIVFTHRSDEPVSNHLSGGIAIQQYEERSSDNERRESEKDEKAEDVRRSSDEDRRGGRRIDPESIEDQRNDRSKKTSDDQIQDHRYADH